MQTQTFGAAGPGATGLHGGVMTSQLLSCRRSCDPTNKWPGEFTDSMVFH